MDDHHRSLRFNPEVNLGHLLQIGSLIVAIVVFAVVTDRRFTVLEIKQLYYDKILEEIQVQVKLLSDNQTAVLRNQDKLTLILEGMKKQEH